MPNINLNRRVLFGSVRIPNPPIFVGTGSEAQDGTDATLPVGWQPGDLHILIQETASFSAPAGAATSPAGWTRLTTARANDGVSAGGSVSVDYRFAQSGDADVTIQNLYAHTGGVVMGWRGVNAASPFEATVASDQISVSGGNLAYNNISTLGLNRVALQIFGMYWSSSGPVTGTPNADWIERVEVSSPSVSVAWSIFADSKLVAAAGAVGAGNRSYSGGSSIYSGRIATCLVPAA